MRDQQHDSSGGKPGDFVGILYLLCNVHCSCITPFIRTGFGVEHPGIYGFYAMILMLFIAAADRTGVTTLYVILWLGAVIVRRIQTFTLIRQGNIIHSRYGGFPWAAMRVPFVRKESTATGIVEPELCALAGISLMPLSESLGMFIMAGFVSFLVRSAIEKEVIKKRLQAMHDARIEQEYYSWRFRNPMEE